METVYASLDCFARARTSFGRNIFIAASVPMLLLLLFSLLSFQRARGKGGGEGKWWYNNSIRFYQRKFVNEILGLFENGAQPCLVNQKHRVTMGSI